MSARSEQITAVAKRFHETYEALAPSLGYKTRDESAVPWEQVPETNRLLMRQVVTVLVVEGTIHLPEVSP